jgi:hypothetical protein
MSPEEAAAEDRQVRGNPDHDANHPGRPGHKAAWERQLQIMRRGFGATAPSTSPTPSAPAPPKSEFQRKLEERYGIAPETPDAPPTEAEAAAQRAEQDAQAWPFQRPEVPEGRTWDADAEVALRTLTVSHDVPVAELNEMAAEYRRAWDRRDMDPVARVAAGEAALRQAWGPHFELQRARAAQMFNQLSPRLQQHIRSVGMDQDAALPLRLAAWWARQHTRGGR